MIRALTGLLLCTLPLEVREHQREVELVLKLAGRAGTVWFSTSSLQLERLAR